MKSLKALTRAALRALPLPPVVDGDKETKGRILIIAGSRQVPGAAILTAMAAMRAGAGKLRLIALEDLAVPTGLAMPEAMVVGLPEARGGGFTRAAVCGIGGQAERVDVVVAGPGLARSKTCAALAEALLASSANVVLDAALLHSLKRAGEEVEGREPPILLPHSGELASLLDCDEEEIHRDPVDCGLRAARLYRANVLVKGVVSHVVTPDGRAWAYKGGAPGLGVSGSGDALAGIVGGLLTRGADSLTALLWGVLLHGEAGEVLSRNVGPVGFLAREISDEVPALLTR